MSTALVPSNGGFGREQIELLKQTICAGATDAELSLFIEASKRLGLDPFARQVFAVKRWDSNARREVMAIQVSVDGFRLVAERTGKYAGQLGPFWTADGKEWLEVWLRKDPPAAAKVGVLRHDFKEPVWQVATWEQYKQTKRDGGLSSMWAKMGPLMLAKCAESLALRRAFPNELSGVYTQEEMQQAEPVRVDVEAEEAEARQQYREAVRGDDGPRNLKSPGDATAVVTPAAMPESTRAGRAEEAGTTNGVRRANQVPHNGEPATKAQIAKLHMLKPEVGGLSDDLYRKALGAYKDQKGKPITTSKDLSKEQIGNLIDRLEAQIARQARTKEAMDAATPENMAHVVAPASFAERLHDIFQSAEDESMFFEQIGLTDADSVPEESRSMVLELARAKQDNAVAYHDALKKARDLGHVPSLVR